MQGAIPAGQSAQIVGSLTAGFGTCLEATILYDGRELEGARVFCDGSPGCSRVELQATIGLPAYGHHTIEFLVVRQSAAVVDYRVEGEFRSSGETLPLGPSEEQLAAGETVSYRVFLGPPDNVDPRGEGPWNHYGPG
jgi:hypothetical protein